MKSVQANLLEIILTEHFGSIVGSVGKCIFTNGPSPLITISQQSKKSIANVKKSLMILIQQQMVQVNLHPRGFLEYTIDFNRVLILTRYPLYIAEAKNMYDESVEMLMIVFMREGQISITNMFNFFKLKEPDESVHLELLENLRKTFVDLFRDDLIVQKPDISQKMIEDQLAERMKNDQEARADKYQAVRIFSSNILNENPVHPRDIFEQIEKMARTAVANSVSAPKRIKFEKTIFDDGILWALNYRQLDQLLRNKLLSESMKRKYDDDKIGKIISLFLTSSNSRTNHLATETSAVSRPEIIKLALEGGICSSSEEINDYIQLLSDDKSPNATFIMQEGCLGGGMFVFKTLKALEMLVISCIASIIECRYGESYSRVFKIVAKKKYIHPNLIHDLALIDRNRCKEITFCLVQEGFITTNYYPKGTDYIPPKTFYVFSIDLKTLANSIINTCYKALLNCETKRIYEFESKRSLIEKKNFIETEIAALEARGDCQQLIDDLQNTIPQHDFDIMKKYDEKKLKLETSEFRVQDTLFLLTSWLELENASVRK